MKNNLFIISGPSGAGEDSIMNALRERHNIKKVITTTSREKRQKESEGDPYYFLSKEEFKKNIDNNSFFEWAIEDNGNYYGNTYREIDRVKNSDEKFIIKLDYQGVIAYKKLFPKAVSILINVPWEVLEKRIRNRDQVSDEFVEGRRKHSEGWYKNKDKFDHIIENKDGKLEEAIKNTYKIINSCQ